jgi:hypothetical protein
MPYYMTQGMLILPLLNPSFEKSGPGRRNIFRPEIANFSPGSLISTAPETKIF